MLLLFSKDQDQDATNQYLQQEPLIDHKSIIDCLNVCEAQLPECISAGKGAGPGTGVAGRAELEIN